MLPPETFQPWCTVEPLSESCRREVRRRAIFECCKWDPQVEDVDTLAPLAIVLKRRVWESLSQAAELLAAETLVVEQELGRRPELHRALGLPRRLRTALASRRTGDLQPQDVRVMRFDFHPTSNGWRVSEVNSDVPGGYNEASGLTSIVAEHVPAGNPCGDTAERLIEAISDRIPPGGTVALVHATAYTDDRQVMTFLGRRLERRGFRAVLAAPDHIGWSDGHARIETDWFQGTADFLFRFFPAEWLPNLGRRAHWHKFFGGTITPLCNPGTALLTQSKRWPLVSRRIGLHLNGWERLSTETADPREVDWSSDHSWVLKPAFGRVGESIGMQDVTGEREWKVIRRSVRWRARYWVAQRRFTPQPIALGGQQWHVCLGVYTVQGRAAGIYGRVAERPLINHLAREAAVLVEAETGRREDGLAGAESLTAQPALLTAHRLA